MFFKCVSGLRKSTLWFWPFGVTLRFMVSWPDGRSMTSHVEEGRGSYEQSAGESQDGVICRLGQQREYRR